MKFYKKKKFYIPIIILFYLMLFANITRVMGALTMIGIVVGGIYLFKNEGFKLKTKLIKRLTGLGLGVLFVFFGIGGVTYNDETQEQQQLATDKIKQEQVIKEKPYENELQETGQSHVQNKIKDKQIIVSREIKRKAEKEARRKLEKEKIRKEQEQKKKLAQQLQKKAEAEKKQQIIEVSNTKTKNTYTPTTVSKKDKPSINIKKSKIKKPKAGTTVKKKK